MAESPAPFRVIIVGGGPVGLIMARMLAAVHVDFVLLEKHHTFVTENGASHVIWPQNHRVLDQLGYLPRADNFRLPTDTKTNLAPGGKVLSKTDMLQEVEILHGHPWGMYRRYHIIEFLLEGLPDKSKAKTSKAVTDMSLTPSGVKVTCADGTVEEGSIVIGADGVQSTVRSHMQRIAREAGDNIDETPFHADFVGLFSSCELPQGMAPGKAWEVRGKDAHMQVIAFTKYLTFAAYMPLPKRAETTTQTHTYTLEEQEAVAAKIADHNITETLKWGDVWPKRGWTWMTNLHEGCAKHWHYGGRIVLLGDSAVKSEPELGMSFNTGVQSAVALTNRLRRLLREDANPAPEKLTALFRAWREERRKPVEKIGTLSRQVTRMLAWENPIVAFLDRNVLNPIKFDMIFTRRVAAPLTTEAKVLDFLPEHSLKKGKVPWKVFPDPKLVEEEKKYAEEVTKESKRLVEAVA